MEVFYYVMEGKVSLHGSFLLCDGRSNVREWKNFTMRWKVKCPCMEEFHYVIEGQTSVNGRILLCDGGSNVREWKNFTM